MTESATQMTAPNPGLWQVQNFLEESEPKTINPVQLILRIFRGRWLKTIALSGLTGLTLAFVAYRLITPLYESEGLVRVVAREEKILYADRDDSRLRLYDAFVSAEATYLQSQPVIKRAHDQLSSGLHANGDLLNTTPIPTVKDYAGALTVKKLKGLISVKAKHPSPAMAQHMVGTLLDSYAELHAQQSGSRQSLRVRELDGRVAMLLTRQTDLSKEILMVGEEYDQASLAKAHMTKVTQLEEVDQRIAELTATLLEMEASDGALDADTGDMEIKRATLLDRAMADMVFERAKRAAELEKLRLRYQPTHAKVANLAASIKIIDDAIESRRRLIATLGKTGAITAGDGASKSQSLAELKALTRKLTKRRTDLSDEARVLNGKLIDLKRLSEENYQITGMLAETRRILDQVRLESRNSLPGTIEILSRASKATDPVSDKRKPAALLALMFGGFMIFACVFVWRQFSGRLIYSDDVARLTPNKEKVSAIKSPADTADLIAFFTELQLSPHWPSQGASTIAFTRLGEQTELPMVQIAHLAGEMGLKTLLVAGSEEWRSDLPGFEDAVRGKADPTVLSMPTFDIMLYGSARLGHGYTLDQAHKWLDHWQNQYDLILIYTGVFERHFSSRVLPGLAHITVGVLSPGDRERVVRRLASQVATLSLLLTGARNDDPGLQEADYQTPSKKGLSHAQAA